MDANSENSKLGSKVCANCRVEMPISDFYKKGSRVDGSCKACILERKKLVRTKRAKASAKRTNKVLLVNEMKFDEKATDSGPDIKHLETLLAQFIFTSVCRVGEENGQN